MSASGGQAPPTNAAAASADAKGSSSASSGPPNSFPTINLPKGGGAVRSIGEKFSVNSATGTASANVPIPISETRSGFGPHLALSYDSGAGSGPFGYGWTLGLQSISRKTDKGLPRYLDDVDSDVFQLTGAEDLVPVLYYADGKWDRLGPTIRVYRGNEYVVEHYRPRVEGSWAKIEFWRSKESDDSFWKTISSTNVTTFYGTSSASRIQDPCQPKGSSHIFKWLVCEAYDDKGNAIMYEYKAEDSEDVDCSKSCEQHRSEKSRSAQRYVKRIKYGNYISHLLQPECKDWMFEIVFDYGEHDLEVPSIHESKSWKSRPDPFSSYRSAFEVRTYRTCKRILMFHHFPDEPSIGGDCLVASVDINYSTEQEFNNGSRIGLFIDSVCQRAYVREESGYKHESLPPFVFQYSQPTIEQEVRDLSDSVIRDLPSSIDDSLYRWLDLDGEGIPGILAEQAGGYFYKSNLGDGVFGPWSSLPSLPSLVSGSSTGSQNESQEQFMDLDGNGKLELVQFGGSTPGFYTRDPLSPTGWQAFKPFESIPNQLKASSAIQYLDLTGDGLTDVLLANDEVFTWYESIGLNGFEPARYTRTPIDDKNGPKLLYSDLQQTIYVADMTGDGLSDLVRIGNKSICYWPNLGYCQFGAMVVMANAPCFDDATSFQQNRIRLFDIDGSGTTDIIYLHEKGVRYYQNELGNGWSSEHHIPVFPKVDTMASVSVVDLFGNGTGCLVWSSNLLGDYGRHIRYVDLLGSQKPHLLISWSNSLGIDTHVRYSSSTHFYLDDKLAGRPWVTRLGFPVQCVAAIETVDHISKTRFTTQYKYHHGFYDGVEREFRGFGMVEQTDTEHFAALSQSSHGAATNIDYASHSPPILTKTWFHTGAYVEGRMISEHFEKEYYREPNLRADELQAMLLDDTILPDSFRVENKLIRYKLSPTENFEACRALKTSQLHQETYALDGTDSEIHPYVVNEGNFTVEILQPISCNVENAVYLVHSRESVECHYERSMNKIGGRLRADPRVMHALTLRSNEFGEPLESATVSYGRRHGTAKTDREKETLEAQKRTHVVYMVNTYTNSIVGDTVNRNPNQAESLSYEVYNVPLQSHHDCFTSLFRAEDVLQAFHQASDGRHDLPFEDIQGSLARGGRPYRRLLDRHRTIYLKDDLSGPLPLGEQGRLGLTYESYQLSTHLETLQDVFVTPGKLRESSIPSIMKEGGFVDLDSNGNWWVPSGTVGYSLYPAEPPEKDLEYAIEHFFVSRRFRNPFFSDHVHAEWSVDYDRYDLLVTETKDAFGNQITVGERSEDNKRIVKSGQNYRLLKPVLVMDANRNRTAVVYDILGYIVGSALMGKPGESVGDSLEGFNVQLTRQEIRHHLSDPTAHVDVLLGKATNRFVYDIHAYNDGIGPCAMSTVTRVTHVNDLSLGEQTEIMQSITYFDGRSQVAQQKLYAGPGLLHRIQTTKINPTKEEIAHIRWACSAWTILNNKGKPVRKFEPFYTDTSAFEFNVREGVSPILFYDPVQRLVATLFPDNTWSKVVFDAWSDEIWDANDTVLLDPRDDPDVKDYVLRLPGSEKFKTWYQERITGEMGELEKQSAIKAARHANTPTRKFNDALGKPVAVTEMNRTPGLPDELFYTSNLVDVEGTTWTTTDPKGRVVVRNRFNMGGFALHEESMDAGERWMIHDITGSNAVYGWDSREQKFHTIYDVLRRTKEVRLTSPTMENVVVERTVFGEEIENAEATNARQKAVQTFDQAGKLEMGAYDFKGNLLSTVRTFSKEYKSTLDWSGDVGLETDTVENRIEYDALNRDVSKILSDQSKIKFWYNPMGHLRKIQVISEPSASPTVYIRDIQYNARAQRLYIHYGNGVRTDYTYDEFTFRLKSLITRRSRTESEKTRSGETDNWTGKLMQNLEYAYDPMGNVLHIADTAQQCIFFRNDVVTATSDHVYDSTYRLIESSGREHLAQAKHGRQDKSEKSVSGGVHLHDSHAMGRYTERYRYDSTGNMLSLQHDSTDAQLASWTRKYTYEEPSGIDSNVYGNRLSSLMIGDTGEVFRYDGLEGKMGNITFMSTLRIMKWDYKNQLQATVRQLVGDDKLPETTYYQYDGRGQRARKIVERAYSRTEEKPMARKLKEMIYASSLETLRKYAGDGTTVDLERSTVRVMDDEKCVALLERRIVGNDKGTALMHRYQLANHQGSIAIEVDDQAQILSYQEYSPYGSTTYKASAAGVETSKRYQYSGKELDSETGLYYYGARYYLPVACRWMSPDPGGTKDGLNVYEFVKSSPISRADPNGMESDWLNRAMGGLQVLGGVMEIAVGAAGLAAPTGVTQVLGAVAVVHGIDTTIAGLRQVFSGEETKTFTAQGATAVAKKMGASDGTAEIIGMGVDMTVGIVASAGAGGVKTLAKGAAALKSEVVAAAKWNGNKVRKVYEGVRKGFQAAELSSARQVVISGGEAALRMAGNGVDDMIMMMSKAHGAVKDGIAAGVKVIKKGGPGVVRGWMNEAEAMAARIADAGGEYGGTLRKHHVFPQQMGEFWAKHKINMHEFIVEIDRTHHQILHGNWGYMQDMNKAWMGWIGEAQKAGSEFSKLATLEAKQGEIMKQMDVLMKTYNLSPPFGKYTGWTKFFAKYGI